MKGRDISPELEFSDEAVSGTKRHRAGLDTMLAAAESGQIDVLYFHSLSRLSRESVITLPLLKQLVYNYGVRIVSVTEGIDSDDTSWELVAHIMSIVHEQYLKDLAENVLRGQEGAVLAGFSVGDYCFGFSSVPIPGSEQGRRGRDAKPRKMYVIGPDTAAWVPRILRWFVVERQSLRWIARELTEWGRPRTTVRRRRNGIISIWPRLLQNSRNVGIWPWGRKKNVRDPLTGKVRQEDRPAEEYAQWQRQLSHLQLIDNETFDEAQRLLEENSETYGAQRKDKGRIRGSTPGVGRQHPRHLLSGLIRCDECRKVFHVGGANGKYLFCPGYRMGVCGCQTTLRRDRAERMILDEIGRKIAADDAWRHVVLDAMQRAWKAQESELPSELAAAEQALADVDRRIKRLVDSIEEGLDEPELAERLSERRAEKRERTTELERLRRKSENRLPEPTEAWVDEQLGNLGDVLAGATPAAAHALRELVGGQIVVTEIRVPGRQRHHLRGRFTIRTAALVNALGAADQVDEQGVSASRGQQAEAIEIDFREPSTSEADSERAFELDQEGWLRADIAEQLSCSPSRLNKLPKDAYARHGLAMPDGRKRRAELKKKHQSKPVYQAISDDVFALLEEGLLIEEIAQRLGCDRNTVTSAKKFAYTSRGLAVPDGRTRRKSLDRKVSRPRSRDGRADGDDGARP